MDDYQKLRNIDLEIQKNNQLFNSLIENDFTSVYRVHLFYTKNDKIIPQTSCIIIPSITKEVLWFDLLSFEVVHGIYRTLMLIPDKLSTVLTIKKENIPYSDNGFFLINLVLDLLNNYIKILVESVSNSTHNLQKENLSSEQKILIIKQNFLNMENYEHFINEQPVYESPNNEEFIEGFPTFLNYLFIELNKLKNILKTNGLDFYIKKSKQVLKKCDIMFSACIIYLDFIHPLLTLIKRNEFESLSIDSYAEKTNIKLVSRKNKLLNKFEEHI